MKLLNESEYNKLQQEKRDILEALKKVNEIRDQLLTERKELRESLKISYKYMSYDFCTKCSGIIPCSECSGFIMYKKDKEKIKQLLSKI